jgi:hypothetical protein
MKPHPEIVPLFIATWVILGNRRNLAHVHRQERPSQEATASRFHHWYWRRWEPAEQVFHRRKIMLENRTHCCKIPITLHDQLRSMINGRNV